MTSIIYCETDPISGRWTGVGRLLSAMEVDQNFYVHDSRIATLEANVHTTVSIAYITMHGDQMTIHMTDHSTQGPFTIPLAVFRDRGAWLPSTSYSVNDIFTENGSLYLVIFDHTSALTFDPNANDGLGHNYYALLLSLPANVLPAGGAVNQVLSKSSSSDYAVTWSYKLPTGGATGQILTKNTSTNQDASWASFPGILTPPPSPAGIAGQVLETFDGSDIHTRWINVIHAPSVSGAAGQVPATNDGTNLNTGWIDVVYAPPASPAGNTNQGLVTTSGSAQDMVWQTLVFAPPASPAGAPGQVIATVDGTPENTEWVTPSGTDVIEFIIDGGGGTITTGLKGYIHVPFAATIVEATLLGDRVGSIVVDIWKTSYTLFNPPGSVPSSGNSITASAIPTISTSYKSQDTTLTGWTTSINDEDVLAINVNSVTSLQRVTVSLKVTK